MPNGALNAAEKSSSSKTNLSVLRQIGGRAAQTCKGRFPRTKLYHLLFHWPGCGRTVAAKVCAVSLHSPLNRRLQSQEYELPMDCVNPLGRAHSL